MLKKLLTVVLPIALPFLVFLGYALLARWQARRTGGDATIPWPWAALTLAGVVLMMATLVGVRFLSEQGGPGTRIVPERLIDGRIQDSEIVED